MALKKWCVAVAGLCLFAACEPGDAEEPVNPTSDGSIQGQPGLPGADASLQDGGVSPFPGSDASQNPPQTGDAGPQQGDASGPGPAVSYDYLMQEVPVTADLVIPAGKTVRVGRGVKFSAKAPPINMPTYKIVVQGELIVEGTADAPSSFVGPAQENSWTGIVVKSGGKLTLSQAKLSGAKYAIFAEPGSSYSIDRVTIDTSFKAAVLQSNGTITNSTFKAVALFPAVTEGVAVDDPNGALTIMDASPTITNCRFDGSGGYNDMIRVGGNASPVFDHIYVGKSHCGFHTSGGTNTSMRVTNSIIENCAYGVMAFATKPIFENNVFKTNTQDVGYCNGATAANLPVLNKNFFATGGALKLDAGCDKLGVKDSAPAAAAIAGAGPSGL